MLAPPLPLVVMDIWNGQYPLLSQAAADVVAIAAMIVATYLPAQSMVQGAAVLVGAIVAFASSGNLTNRWPVTFPLMPWMCLQALRYVLVAGWALTAVNVISAVLVLIAILLSLLFPALQLPPVPNAKYEVGMVDLHLPIDVDAVKKMRANVPVDNPYVGQEQIDDHVMVRIWYPIAPAGANHSDEQKTKKKTISYLRPDAVIEFCEEIMMTGAPTEAAKKFAFLFHTLRLPRAPAVQHAPLMTASTGPSKFPVIVYSHGLAGNACIYSYQTFAMAAKGYVVFSVEHADGTAPVVRRKDGSLLRYDREILKPFHEKKYMEYKQRRRAQAEFRTDEYLGVLQAALSLNEKNIPELERIGLDFSGRLDTNDLNFMGHSFGAATVLNAAHIWKPTAVIAHEPASDWMPDSSRRVLFDQKLLDKISDKLPTETGSFPDDFVVHESRHHLHDDMDMIILSSEEWKIKKWSGAHLFEDLLKGATRGAAHIFEGSAHTDFSDLGMVLPRWLCQLVNFSGKNNPISQAEEIHIKSLEFLNSVKESKKKE